MRTRAPIFRSLRRIVPHVAAASAVWASPIRRKAHRSTPAFAGAGSGHRGKPQPQLVGPHAGCRGPISKEVALALFDSVLHLAPGAIEVLIERPRGPLVGLERGHQKARV